MSDFVKEVFHHIYGPSSMGRRLLCPGSARMERGVPEIQSEGAKRGTLCHAAVRSYALDKDLTEDELSAVDKCRRFLEEQIELCRALPVSDGLGEYANAFPTVFHEWKIRYELPRLGIWPEGTLDVAIMPIHSWVEARIVDWKYQHDEPSEPFVSLQLACYALGLYEHLTQYERIVATAYFPRLERRYEVAITDFEKARTQVEAVVERCEDPNAPLIPGDEQCRYCRALHTCPAVVSALEIVKAPERLPVSPIEMARRLELGALAEKWYARQKEIAKELSEAGMEIPGYALVTRRGNLTIEDPQAAYEAVADRITPEEMLRCVDVKITRLKEVYASKLGDMTKKETDRAFEAALGGVLKRKPDITYLGRTRKE